MIFGLRLFRKRINIICGNVIDIQSTLFLLNNCLLNNNIFTQSTTNPFEFAKKKKQCVCEISPNNKRMKYKNTLKNI